MSLSDPKRRRVRRSAEVRDNVLEISAPSAALGETLTPAQEAALDFIEAVILPGLVEEIEK